MFAEVTRLLCDCTETAGLGGVVNGTVVLQAGQVLLIVIGQVGQSVVLSSGGGGASFVLFANESLIVAGGGGGTPIYGVFWTTCRFGISSIQNIKAFFWRSRI